ncbi:MAG: DUF3786 domain-containing protein [Clostridia bacterium]|nr:DUF3786 domain-containing protein [Clostridia bacterium]NCC45166.1 DUF3786 domain-containing protein [Clostridia bacterium]
MELQYDKDSKERIPYEHYMELFQKADPKEISVRTGIPYDETRQLFELNLMGVNYQVKFPEYEVSHIEEDKIKYYPLEDAVNARILVLRYLVEGHAAPTTGKFLTYRETPWGTVYLKQFQGRCISRLAYGFGNKQPQFQNAMEKIGAKKLLHGDIAYEFEFLNGFRLQMILWAGDDEFPPSSQILFSDNFPVAFQAEDMAVVGDISISMIKALNQ